MRIRSRQSARSVRTQRSAWAARFRRLDRRADHRDVFAAEDVVEGAADLRISVADEEPERLLFAELHDKVACLLGDPARRVHKFGRTDETACLQEDRISAPHGVRELGKPVGCVNSGPPEHRHVASDRPELPQWIPNERRGF